MNPIGSEIQLMNVAMAKIYAAQIRRSHVLREEMPNVQESITVREAIALVFVTNQTKEDGKPLYTNEQSRKAAADARLAESTEAGEYKAFLALRRKLQMELDELDAGIELERRVSSVAKLSAQSVIAGMQS